jgi:hypothetical protein
MKHKKMSLMAQKSAQPLGIQKKIYTGVSAKSFEPNISVIFQRIFVKFKMQIF